MKITRKATWNPVNIRKSGRLFSLNPSLWLFYTYSAIFICKLDTNSSKGAFKNLVMYLNYVYYANYVP